MNKKFFFPSVVFATTLLCSQLLCPHLFASVDQESSVKEDVRTIIRNELLKDNRSIYEVPSSLNFDLEYAIDKATDQIQDFLDSMERIVLRSELDRSVDQAIEEEFGRNGIYLPSVPYSVRKKIDKKRDKVISSAESDMWIYDYEYIKKDDLERIVSSKIDYFFIEKIKDILESDWGWHFD